ncbi:MAG: PEP-CTERM sorting domain-containing protein [Verrucomicrobiota bacterium]
MKKLRSFRSLSLAVASGFVIFSASAATFDDVQYWVGSGANKAAFVIDWNDGKSAESLLWGYRWDGAATGLDMFQAVVNADSRLYAHVGSYAWGTAILGIGFDLNGNGNFGVTPALSFNSGGLFSSTSPNDARVSVEAGDHYVEGWNTGYWEYFNKSSAVDAWASASGGITDRVLTDGAWDGLNFNLGFAWPGATPSEPIAVTAVPEPSALALISLSALVLTCARRKP